MVCEGDCSSHRKRLGMASHRWPVATSGCVSVLSERIWVKSALQVWRFVCAASQPLRTALVSAAPARVVTMQARTVIKNSRRSAETSNFEHPRTNAQRVCALAVGRWRLDLGYLLIGAFASTRARNDTIDQHAGKSPARAHAGFPASV